MCRARSILQQSLVEDDFGTTVLRLLRPDKRQFVCAGMAARGEIVLKNEFMRLFMT